MTYLLDVSTLLAFLWQTHAFHQRASGWLEGKKLAVCPITELGFLRISAAASSDFRLQISDFKFQICWISDLRFVSDFGPGASHYQLPITGYRIRSFRLNAPKTAR